MKRRQEGHHYSNVPAVLYRHLLLDEILKNKPHIEKERQNTCNEATVENWQNNGDTEKHLVQCLYRNPDIET